MRNKQTGLDYAFMMVVMPDLNYMLQKGNELDQNRYLTRESDLSGTVMFYTTDGEFINGWIYENGKITGGIGGSGKQLKALGTRCYYLDFFAVNAITHEEYYIGSNTHCETGFFDVDISFPDPGLVGGGVDPGLLPIGVGGTPTLSRNKKPETRTHCSGSATQNAANAQNAMKVPDVLANLNFLREYAKGKDNEWGLLINSYYGSYTASDLKEGKTGSATIAVNSSTIYDIHTHTDDKREGYNVYTGFSVGDIYGTFEASNTYNNYKGSIVISYDGSEYLLAVDDRSKLLQFWGNMANRELFKSGDNTIFKNKGMDDEYRDIRRYLESQKYSNDDAHDYALSYLLDKYNTGLKISKKEKGTDSFKETKTTQDTKTKEYKPSICP